jgi:hypothetical protein
MISFPNICLGIRTQSQVFVVYGHSFLDDLGVYNGECGEGEGLKATI